MPRPPAHELVAQVRHDDRQLAAQWRNLVLEVDRIALVRPQEHLKDVLQPGIYYVNPRLVKVNVVPVGYDAITLEHASASPIRGDRSRIRNQNGSNNPSDNPGTSVRFYSGDGYLVEADLTLVWGVAPADAPEIVANVGGWDLVRKVLRVANVGVSAASVAAAERVLETAVSYARTRKQFGVPIGSFQAVKHPLANLCAEIESARSAYHYAAWAVDAASADSESAVAVARLAATGAYRSATLVSLQAHGGIGFTWEADVHWLYKRAQIDAALLGDAARQRARLATILAQRAAPLDTAQVL